MHLPVLAHALVWLENGNHQSRAKNHRLGKARHESDGQVQEEMKELKIINRSGVRIELMETAYGFQQEKWIPIGPGLEYNYLYNRKLDRRKICLYLPHDEPIKNPFMYLDCFFMDAYKIAYVRRGDGDCWFIDPVRRKTKLVRKCVCNSTTSQIALLEFVLEREDETQRLPEKKNYPGSWTAWWEVTVASTKKELLIVDPVAVEEGHRQYFGREGGGLPLVGSPHPVNMPHPVSMLRGQNNIHEIIRAQYNEHVEVKERSGGMLDWTSSRRPWFLV